MPGLIDSSMTLLSALQHISELDNSHLYGTLGKLGLVTSETEGGSVVRQNNGKHLCECAEI